MAAAVGSSLRTLYCGRGNFVRFDFFDLGGGDVAAAVVGTGKASVVVFRIACYDNDEDDVVVNSGIILAKLVVGAQMLVDFPP